jgi:hypothetical protein
VENINKLIKSLKEFKEHLEKGDALDEKIKAKLKAEMDKRKFTETDAVRHIIDRDKGDKQPPKPKKEQLLQSEQEVLKYSSNGQWQLDKSNEVKPFGQNIYDEKANVERKATRTGEERPEVGRNKGVRQYTTSGASITRAYEAATAKEQKAKTKASTRTFANMSEEEKAALRAKYEKPLAKGADVAREALTTGDLPVLAQAKPQPTDQELFGHLVKTEEQAKVEDARWKDGIKQNLIELSGPVDHLNKSKIEVKWSYGKSFNSLLKERLSEKEIAERNMHVGEE